jgi:hypothetical protein
MELFGIKIFGIKTIDIRLLHLTSLLFFINFIHNTWHREFPYAWLFLLLTTTSVFIHSGIFITTHESLDFQNQLIFLDKSIILSIIIYGGILFWKTNLLRPTSFIPITTFLTVAYMYGVGYFQNKYSYDYDPDMAEISHAALHILSCLGHNIIIYEYGRLK